jgi:glycerate kinase
MKILIAPDKLKGALSAADAAHCIEKGFRVHFPKAVYRHVPLADGGEGFLDALLDGTKGKRIYVNGVRDALMRPRRVCYGWLPGPRLAVIELPLVAGWAQLKPKERDPLRTTTYGVGQLILHAARKGARKIIVGLGGSATNDAGAGLGQALGYRLLDVRGKVVKPGGGELGGVMQVEAPDDLQLPEIVAAVDVQSPLCGKSGASHVFGPQKGASPADVLKLDANLRHFSNLVNPRAALVPGAGAAGGTSYGLMCFAGAKLQPGFDLVSEARNLEEEVRKADLIITAEGSLDAQTSVGKAPERLRQLAALHGKPIMALAGRVETGNAFSLALSLAPWPMSVEESVRNTEVFLTQRAAVMAGLIQAGMRLR